MLAHFCCFSSILRLGLVVDCALIAHAPMEGRELAGLFRSDASGCSIILKSVFTCSVLLSVGSTGRGQGPTSTQNNLGLLLGPNLSLGLLDCHLLAHNPLGAENAAVPRLDVLSLPLHRLWIALYELDGGERPPP